MSNIFVTVLNMSATASYAIFVVIIFRYIIRKTPKIFSYALWLVVLFRLLCPISFESSLSIVPKSNYITDISQSYINSTSNITIHADNDIVISDITNNTSYIEHESSNTYDYINQNKDIFKEIVDYGDTAIIYCYSAFEKGGQTDLKGSIMMYVCQHIVSNYYKQQMNSTGYETGQQWYDDFKEYALYAYENFGIGYLEKHLPAEYMLVKMIKGNIDDYSNEVMLNML